jgi:hypothetical protein
MSDHIEITREIEHCLSECKDCTGHYVDSIQGNRIRIICRHSCHNDTVRSEK